MSHLIPHLLLTLSPPVVSGNRVSPVAVARGRGCAPGWRSRESWRIAERSASRSPPRSWLSDFGSCEPRPADRRLLAPARSVALMPSCFSSLSRGFGQPRSTEDPPDAAEQAGVLGHVLIQLTEVQPHPLAARALVQLD